MDNQNVLKWTIDYLKILFFQILEIDIRFKKIDLFFKLNIKRIK